jgi:hypothetical protein
MILSPLIDDRHRQLRRFSPDGAHARLASPDRPAKAPPTLPHDLASPRSPLCLRPSCNPKRLRQPHPSHTLASVPTVKSP